jgi:hypothetical protein
LDGPRLSVPPFGEQRRSGVADGFGVDCTAQEVPSQRSASVMPLPELSRKVPTAVQAEADEHDTAFKNGPCGPGGSGIDWRLHVVPSHRSASAWSVPELSK